MIRITNILILMYVLVSCQFCKNANTDLITDHRIGNIFLGQKYKDLLKSNGVSIDTIDLSCEFSKTDIKELIGYRKQGVNIYTQRSLGSVGKTVTNVHCESEKFKTSNGLHVGMKIEELRKIYPEVGHTLKGGKTTNTGRFCPKDLIIRNKNKFPISYLCLKLAIQESKDTIVESISIELYK